MSPFPFPPPRPIRKERRGSPGCGSQVISLRANQPLPRWISELPGRAVPGVEPTLGAGRTAEMLERALPPPLTSSEGTWVSRSLTAPHPSSLGPAASYNLLGWPGLRVRDALRREVAGYCTCTSWPSAGLPSLLPGPQHQGPGVAWPGPCRRVGSQWAGSIFVDSPIDQI